jgi:hypothetical protein
MDTIFPTLIILAVVVLPFLMMVVMWRRMKRVQAQVHHARKRDPLEQPWQEPIQSQDVLTLARAESPNNELLTLGARARQSRWPLDNG